MLVDPLDIVKSGRPAPADPAAAAALALDHERQADQLGRAVANANAAGRPAKGLARDAERERKAAEARRAEADGILGKSDPVDPLALVHGGNPRNVPGIRIGSVDYKQVQHVDLNDRSRQKGLRPAETPPVRVVNEDTRQPTPTRVGGVLVPPGSGFPGAARGR